MKPKLQCWILAAALLCMGNFAQAAINCNLSSPGASSNYDGSAVTAQSSFTINCTRLSNDPSSSSFTLRPNNGLNASGQSNRAAFSGNFLNYGEYIDSACASPWRASGNSRTAITGTITFVGTALTTTTNGNFWVCIPAAQTYVAGNYTDTVTMTLTYGSSTTTATHPISISTQSNCSISSPPGTVSFTYTALQQSASTASSTFSTTCTNTVSYSMTVSSEGGVVSGLNYSLKLNTTSSGGSNPLGSTGTGGVQTFYINGTMPANQAGTCGTGGCTASQSHSLTISF